jgi:hypothetical protein
VKATDEKLLDTFVERLLNRLSDRNSGKRVETDNQLELVDLQAANLDASKAVLGKPGVVRGTGEPHEKLSISDTDANKAAEGRTGGRTGGRHDKISSSHTDADKAAVGNTGGRTGGRHDKISSSHTDASKAAVGKIGVVRGTGEPYEKKSDLDRDFLKALLDKIGVRRPSSDAR